MAKVILKNTETFAAVKISGTGATETIDLQTDLIIPNRLVLNGATQKVNILSMTWAGAAGSSVKITRGGVDIIRVDGEAANSISFDNMGFNDNVNNSSDIVVAVTGDGYIYLALRKESGYKQTFEPEVYSVYDNPNVVDTPINPNP